MPVNKLTKEQMEERHLGKTINGVKVLEFLRTAETRGGRQHWIVLGQCRCGKQYEVSLASLQSNKMNSCGCGRRMDLEKKRQALVGKVYNDNLILDVVRDEIKPEQMQAHRWVVLAKCPCGKEYETLLHTIRSNKLASCGCRNRLRGRKALGRPERTEPLTTEPIVRSKPKKPRAERLYKKVETLTKKAKKPTPKKVKVSEELPLVEDIVNDVQTTLADIGLGDLKVPKILTTDGNASRIRLVKIWGKLPRRQLCKAWHDGPEGFVEWSIRNGFAKDKQLVRIDALKNYSPMNTRWETNK